MHGAEDMITRPTVTRKRDTVVQSVPRERMKGGASSTVQTEKRGPKEEVKDPLKQQDAPMKKGVNRANDMMGVAAIWEKDLSIKNAPRENEAAKEEVSRVVSDPIKSANKRDAHSMLGERTVVALPGKIISRMSGRMAPVIRIVALLLEKRINHVTSKKEHPAV